MAVGKSPLFDLDCVLWEELPNPLHPIIPCWTIWKVISCSLASRPHHCPALEICSLEDRIALKLSSCCASFSTSNIILTVKGWLVNSLAVQLPQEHSSYWFPSFWLRVPVNHTQRDIFPWIFFVALLSFFLPHLCQRLLISFFFFPETKTNLVYWHLSSVTTSTTDLILH